jgi:hypothetical protein
MNFFGRDLTDCLKLSTMHHGSGPEWGILSIVTSSIQNTWQDRQFSAETGSRRKSVEHMAIP